MLQITRKADYGLNFLLTLAKQNQNGPVTLAKIASQKKLPKSFLGKIATTLVKAEIIKAKEGVKGGYILAKKPSEITLAKIFSILEGAGKNYCYGTCDYACSCDFCSMRDVVQPLNVQINQILSQKTLADLMGKGGETSV